MLGFDNTVFDVDKALQFIMSCYNYDGGFGLLPGQESWWCMLQQLHP